MKKWLMDLLRACIGTRARDDDRKYAIEAQIQGGRTIRIETVGSHSTRLQLERIKEDLTVWETNRLGWQVPHVLTAIRVTER